MLADHINSWRQAKGRLILDGFQYDRILEVDYIDREGHLVHAGPVDATNRIEWLNMQRPEDLGAKFKPHPWEQMVKVLREMGRQGAAVEVAIEKQKLQRRPPTLWDRLYGKSCRYGYRPYLLIRWAILSVAIFAVLFKVGGHLGVMGPTDRRIIEEIRLQIAARNTEEIGRHVRC